MKLQEIYNLEPIYTKNDLYIFGSSVRSIVEQNQLCDSKLRFFAEISEYSLTDIQDLINPELYQVRYYLEAGDDKYGAILFSIFFDGKPIMLVKNNGRYYCDYDVFVSDQKQLLIFIDYLMGFLKDHIPEETITTYSLDEEIKNLEFVGDYNLFDYYDSNYVHKYNIGDLVWGWVEENHLKGSYSENYAGFVLTKVKITHINKFNKLNAYFGSQRERGWEYGNCHRMKLYELDSDGVGIGCELNDDLIVGKVDDIPEPKMAIKNFVDKDGFLIENYQVLSIE